MESLEYLKEYLERFKQLNINDFSEIYNSLYTDYDNLQNKIEFSLLINRDNEFDLRFGLFKLYNPQKIVSLFKSTGYEISNLENILFSARDFVPELALGFDFNKNNLRIKVYFLRLPDNPEFNKNPIKKINTISKLADINLTNLDEKELNNCYLMAIDFYQMNKQNIKIYTKDENVNFTRINNYLKENGISSQYFKIFWELFSSGGLKETTISRKYSTNQNGPIGLSVFFEVEDDLNRIIEQLVEISIPEKLTDFKETVKTLERNKPVKYSHIGLTFSENKTKESICLYFSPKFGGS